MNLNQRRNKMLWKRMEEQNNKKPEDDTTKQEELYRVIEKIRNIPKKTK